MITTFVILALTQIKSAGSQNIYRSPKIAWLNDSRITWDFTKTSYTITVKGKLQERQGHRYLDFKLESRDAKGKVTKEEGSFNFWSNDRLLAVGLIDKSQLRFLQNGNPIFLEEEDISAIIPDSRSKKNLYARIYSRAGQPVQKLRQLLEKIKIVAP